MLFTKKKVTFGQGDGRRRYSVSVATRLRGRAAGKRRRRSDGKELWVGGGGAPFRGGPKILVLGIQNFGQVKFSLKK